MTEYKRGILYDTYKAECLKVDKVYIHREKWGKVDCHVYFCREYKERYFGAFSLLKKYVNA